MDGCGDGLRRDPLKLRRPSGCEPPHRWRRDRRVGQIFLHDVDREGLSGYCIYGAGTRGRGIGNGALRYLVAYARDVVGLGELNIITGQKNVVSCRLAERCGFDIEGSSREHPERDIVNWLGSTSLTEVLPMGLVGRPNRTAFLLPVPIQLCTLRKHIYLGANTEA